MANDLDIHLASESEQIEAFNNLHEVWSGGRSPEEHLRHRLSYAKHRNAMWYVGTLAGRVVVGLGCYRFDFRIHGRIEPGYAFGEVHTRAEHRGKGYAPLLLAWVEEHQKSLGREVGMLYSDINPDYYARLGYVLCPSHEGWADVRALQAEGSAACRLVPFTAGEELPAMESMYASHHARRGLSVARTRTYWEYLLSRDPQNEFYWGVDAPGRRLGYVRLACSAQELKIRDLAIVDDAHRRALLLAVKQLGKNRGLERVGGWMADTPLHRELFNISPRQREITMLKSLRRGLLLEGALIADVDHFQEMDHV